LAGLSTVTYSEPAPVAVAVATAVPTSAALTGIQPPLPVIQPQQNAAAGVPAPAAAQGASAALAGTTIGARGLLDADTSDDLIVDVPDEGEAEHGGGELSAAITSLPADVQMIGYRIMWALAGVVAFVAAGISYFLRDPETEAQSAPRPAAAVPAGAPPGRRPTASAPARP
jgi:hypothetical protein